MDQMMGAGDGGLGGQAGFPLEAWFWEMPVCTRLWTSATVLTSVLVQCDIVNPLKLFYSFRAVFLKHQVSTHGSPRVPRTNPTLKNQMQSLTSNITVLAPRYDFCLLRSTLARSCLPCLLHATLLPPLRGILRPLTRTLLLAPHILLRLPHRDLTVCVYAVSRTPALQHSRLYLVAAQPRYTTLLPRAISIHCPVSTLGFDGIQLRATRHGS